MSGIYVGTADGVKELQLAGGPNKVHGSQTFTKSGTFTVPEGVSRIDITIVGGGSSAAFMYGNYRPSNGDSFNGVAVSCGFSGYVKKIFQYLVKEGETHNIVVGSGGLYRVNGDLNEGIKYYMSTVKNNSYCMRHAIGGDSKFDNIIAYGGGRNANYMYDIDITADEFQNIGSSMSMSSADKLVFRHYSSDIPTSWIYYASGTSNPKRAAYTYNNYVILGDFPGEANNKGILDCGIDGGGSYIILNDLANGKSGWVTITW